MFNDLHKKYKKNSYSQSGEDLILKFICDNLLEISKPTYLDIGAFHPFKYNNFQIFYDNGSRGINVEPNPINYLLFRKFRKHDINLNIGIGVDNLSMKYFVMKDPELNTFVKEEALKRKEMIVKEIDLTIKTINTIIELYFNNFAPNIVSIDVEGLDYDIVKSINFEKYKPLLLCIETIEYKSTNIWKKKLDIKEFLESRGYLHHSDTMINSIFILGSGLKNIIIE